jgi:UDP-galactopyranose mutase
MHRSVDFLIVGAGFAGSVLAERLAAGGGKSVLVVDRRGHVGGNAYDHHDGYGILVQKYGPHVFHTNARHVFEYLSHFTAWRPYRHRVMASVGGQLVPFPINGNTINQLYGLELDGEELAQFLAVRAEPRSPIHTSEDLVVSRVGRELYETFFRGYTRKQWGLDPAELDASVAARVPVRLGTNDDYFADRYQAMPRDGFTQMFGAMLSHPNIEVALGTDYRDVKDVVRYRELVYTGPIDEFFGHCFGPLPYRSLEFKYETLDRRVHQPVAVVNYPGDEPFTRVTEFKYLTGQDHPQTTVAYEYPRDGGEPCYPVPREENARLYRRYRALADRLPNVHFVGRLASYRYYNMDQVVAQALARYARIMRRDAAVGRTRSVPLPA